MMKALPEGVIEELDILDKEALQRVISRCEVNVRDTQYAMAQDDELESLKEKLKQAKAPYLDAVKAQRAKARYASHLLDRMGSTQ